MVHISKCFRFGVTPPYKFEDFIYLRNNNQYTTNAEINLQNILVSRHGYKFSFLHTKKKWKPISIFPNVFSRRKRSIFQHNLKSLGDHRQDVLKY